MASPSLSRPVWSRLGAAPRPIDLVSGYRDRDTGENSVRRLEVAGRAARPSTRREAREPYSAVGRRKLPGEALVAPSDVPAARPPYRSPRSNSINPACTAPPPATMSPRSQDRSSPAESVTSPPASWISRPTAATSHGANATRRTREDRRLRREVDLGPVVARPVLDPHVPVAPQACRPDHLCSAVGGAQATSALRDRDPIGGRHVHGSADFVA